MKTKSNKKQLSTITRIMLFFAGLVLLSMIIVYAVSFDNLPMSLSLIGITMNKWIVAAFMVLVGILGSSMIKSAFIGTYKLD